MRAAMLIQLACWMDGHLVRDAGPVRIEGISTDTRTLAAQSGVLFVALKGDNFDGHDHVQQAARLGACAAVVSREIECDLPQIVVDNTAHALAKLAAKLQSLRKTRVIALTGSNGKTTVKQLTVSILQKVGKTYCNPGNRNNEIGLPLAVIDAPEDAQFAVYEMGAGQPGDIAWLTAIAPPDIALVNNIAPAHLERMHSLLGIAETKAAIYDALPENGVAVINADDAFAEFFAARVPGRKILRFGLEASAEIRAKDIQPCAGRLKFGLRTPQGEANIWLPLPGRHNVSNALAATALALAAGASLDAVAAGLYEAQPVPGRMYRHQFNNGSVLIDDSYNANPGSLSAAIEALADVSRHQSLDAANPVPKKSAIKSGRKAMLVGKQPIVPGAATLRAQAWDQPSWLILGDMRDLGPEAENLHAAAGEQACKAGISKLFALGKLSAAAAKAFGENAQHFDTHDALIAALNTELAHTQEPPVMLVKGSRGSAMEHVVNALVQTEEARHAA